MPLNQSIKFNNNLLHIDGVPVPDIVAEVGSPTYIYSIRRALQNYSRIQVAFSRMDAHVHYSMKANANLQVLRHLTKAGAGIDAVSGGEIHRALRIGTDPQKIVFAGVGKTDVEIKYALERGVGWFNVENVTELQLINQFAESLGITQVRVALRFNPDVTADTHPYIATGHGAAKFGLTANAIAEQLQLQAEYTNLEFAGIHVHIGSQLGNISATTEAVERALELIAPYPHIRTINIGGGFPVPYRTDSSLPSVDDFATALRPILTGYKVLLEPGRSIIADAGILVAKVLYVKHQAGQRIIITDASIAELIRPALYQAHHDIIAVVGDRVTHSPAQVVGPVCETADVLGRDVMLPDLQSGALLSVLTTGAYGMVMATSYNARPLPAEVVVTENGETWQVARRRQTWDDLIREEV